jgi:hypothetical protein
LTKITIAVVVVLTLAINTQMARPADLSIRSKTSHKRVIEKQRNIDPAEKELLFQQFYEQMLFEEYLEWLKNRTDLLQEDIPIRLVLRPSVAQ